ncbi:MAG TPA: outer membrane beta-barrel protein, partial [Sphingomicrobium sp.]|nr:outer membrane beta-barrel protein [Sphingomicrobium sp.]
MRKLLLSGVALASLVTVSPAAAKDNTWYVGTDIGAVWPKSQNIFGAVDFTNGLVTDIPETDIGELKYKTGFDVDLIAGYDFGMFRVEGELGYKHAKAKELDLDGTFFTGINTDAGGTVIDISDLDVDEKTNVWSAMLNGWLDFGGNDGFGGGVGGGVGYAGVHQFGDSNSKFAWQLLAQAYYPISPNFDIGLKYRYFHAGSSDNVESFDFTGPLVCNAVPPDVCSGGTLFLEDRTR